MKLFSCVLLALLFNLFACDNDRKAPRLQPIPAATPEVKAPLSLEIVKPLALVSLGSSVDLQLEAKGEVNEASLKWNLTGKIPLGLVFKSSGRTATLQGIVIEARTYPFVISVHDNTGKKASQSFELVVSENPIRIVTQTLPPALQGQPYRAVIEAKGGVDTDYAWKLSEKSLLKGFNTQVEGGKLILSGMTNEVGTSTLEALVQNKFGQQSSQTLTLAVHSVLKIIQDKPPTGMQNEIYNYKMQVAGGKGQGFTWSITSGSLPPGLKAQVGADGTSWTLNGEPQKNGIFNIQVEVTDASSGRASTDLVIDIRPALTFVTDTLPEGKAGTPYKAEIQVKGGLSESYEWKNIVGLPSEIKATYDNKKGTIVLEGTPLEPGSKYLSIEISDSQRSLSRSFSFYVRSTPPVILTEGLADVSYGQPVRLVIQGQSLQMRSMYWRKDDASLLPPGLWLESSNSTQTVLSGHAMYPGTYSFKLVFGDNQGTSEKTFQLRVLPPAPAFTLLGRQLPRALLNQTYEADIYSKNGGIKSFALDGQLPKGLQLQQADDNILRLKGTIKEAGFFRFKIRVRSLDGATAEGSYALAVVQKMDWMLVWVEEAAFLVNKYDVSKKIPLNTENLFQGYMVSPDGRWFAYKTAKTRTGWQDLYLMDLAQAEPAAKRVSDWVSGRINWSPDSSKMVFYATQERGTGGMRVFDILTQTFLKGSGLSSAADSSNAIHWDLAGEKFAYCSRYYSKSVQIIDVAAGEIKDESISLQNIECQEPKFAVSKEFLFLGRDVVRFENHEVKGEARFPWRGALTSLMENPSRLIVGSLQSPFLEFVWNSTVPSDPRSFVIEGEATDYDRFGLSKDEATVFVQRGKETYRMYGAVLTREAISPQPIDVKDDHLNMILDFVNASESGHTLVRTESGIYDLDLATLQRRRIADADALRVEQVFERAPASGFYFVRENISTWTMRSYQDPMTILETIPSTADYIYTDPWDAFAIVNPKTLSYFGVSPAREQPLTGITSRIFLRY